MRTELYPSVCAILYSTSYLHVHKVIIPARTVLEHECKLDRSVESCCVLVCIVDFWLPQDGYVLSEMYSDVVKALQ
jgi:hypothetical protein